MITRILSLSLLVIGVAASSFATPAAPEIDASSAVNAVALLSGAVLVIRSRARR